MNDIIKKMRDELRLILKNSVADCEWCRGIAALTVHIHALPAAPGWGGIARLARLCAAAREAPCPSLAHLCTQTPASHVKSGCLTGAPR